MSPKEPSVQAQHPVNEKRWPRPWPLALPSAPQGTTSWGLGEELPVRYYYSVCRGLCTEGVELLFSESLNVW